MKKTSLLLASLTIVALSFSTQRSVAQDWRFGIKGGLNISNISSDVVNFDSRAAVHLGIFGNTPINSDENLFVQPELLLSLQGAEEGNLTYVNLPVVLKYYIVEQFSIHGGLQLGLLVAAEDDDEEIITTIDLGVPLGAEFNINEDFGVGMRYVIGATDILDVEGAQADFYNRVFQLFASYRFP